MASGNTAAYETRDWKRQLREWCVSPDFRARYEIQSLTRLMPISIGIMVILSAVQWYQGHFLIASLLVAMSFLVWLVVSYIIKSRVVRPFVFFILLCGSAIMITDVLIADPLRPLILSPVFPLLAFFYLGSAVGSWFSLLLGIAIFGILLRNGEAINSLHAINIFFCYGFTALIAYQYEKVRGRTEESLERLSNTDVLTGAYNRRVLDKVLDREINRAKREMLPLSVIMMDIDRFKSINDSLGHTVGDRILKEFCTLVRENIRATDYMIRFGGDEFVIVTPTTDFRHAQMVADKIRSSLREKDFDIGKPVRSSIGIAEFSEEDDIDSLLARADKALYELKSHRSKYRLVKS